MSTHTTLWSYCLLAAAASCVAVNTWLLLYIGSLSLTHTRTHTQKHRPHLHFFAILTPFANVWGSSVTLWNNHKEGISYTFHHPYYYIHRIQVIKRNQRTSAFTAIINDGTCKNRGVHVPLLTLFWLFSTSGSTILFMLVYTRVNHIL